MKFLNIVFVLCGIFVLGACGILSVTLLGGLTGCSRRAAGIPTSPNAVVKTNIKKYSQVEVNGQCLDSYLCEAGDGSDMYYYFPCGCGYHSGCPMVPSQFFGTGNDGSPCVVLFTTSQPIEELTLTPNATPVGSHTPTPTPSATFTFTPTDTFTPTPTNTFTFTPEPIPTANPLVQCIKDATDTFKEDKGKCDQDLKWSQFYQICIVEAVHGLNLNLANCLN